MHFPDTPFVLWFIAYSLILLAVGFIAGMAFSIMQRRWEIRKQINKLMNPHKPVTHEHHNDDSDRVRGL